MARNQSDIDIIQAELSFLRSQYDKAFQERDLRKLKGLSLWIHKLEGKMEKAATMTQKNTVDYIKEYKSQKLINGNSTKYSNTKKVWGKNLETGQ